MSQEAALEFLHVVANAPVLHDRLKELDIKRESPEDQKKLMEIAAEVGYSFTMDEWRAEAKQIAIKQQEAYWSSGELSEEALEAIAGGSKGNCGTGCGTCTNFR